MVAACPSCYHTWKHEYPRVLGEPLGMEVVHATEMLEELLEGGKLPLKPLEQTVTYHDPCDLGRKSGVYDAPRELLTRIPGLEFREMSASGENALCCGGGGDVEVADKDVTAGVAAERLGQVQATGAKYVLSACQQCKRTLQEGARQNKIRVRAMDLTELVWKSVSEASR